MKTKKLLVPIDPARPDINQKGFIYPNSKDGLVTNFLHITSGKTWSCGLVVFIGKEINTADLAARIEESGGCTGKELIDLLDRFIAQVSGLKIGDIVGVEGTTEEFALTKQKKLPLSPRPRLP